MKKKKMRVITIIIILLVIALSTYIITSKPKTKTTKEIAKCIGEKSTLYIQVGCSACKYQEEMFEENYQYLNTIDCFYDTQTCIDKEIQGTPTWEINGKKYLGAKSIDKLKELTGC